MTTTIEQEPVVPVTDLTPGTPEYDEAMSKLAAGSKVTDENGNTRVIGQEDNSSEGVQRPDDIPEKFWDAKEGKVNVPALLKAQADAEAAYRATQVKPKDKEIPDGEEKPAGEETPAEQEQAGVVGDASAEFADKGELTDATYDKLATVGLDRAMVDAYISGQVAQSEQLTSAAYAPFDGSKDNYVTAAEWAANNLTEAEIQALDVQLTSTNPSIIAEGAKALSAKYLEANPSEGTVIRGESGGAPTSGGYFRDSTEVQIAISNPLYKTSAAYRAEVAGKIDRANKAGVTLFG